MPTYSSAGCSVRVCIPDLNACPRVSKMSVPKSALMSKKILLVEDSHTTRLAHRVMIAKRTGYEVISVANGTEALKLAASEKPDLVLMDIMMPGIDGLEVCRRLRKQPATSGIPIVLLTFRVSEESVSEGFASGCTAYLKKPVEVDELVATLRQHMGD
jgi:CheY-like chemotaxis protein